MSNETVRIHHGDQRTVYTTAVPTLFRGRFIKHNEPNPRPQTWLVSGGEPDISESLKSSLEGQDVTHIKIEDLHENLVKFAKNQLGVTPNMSRRKIDAYNMPVEQAIGIEINGSLMEVDTEKISKANKGPALYFYRFGNFTVEKGFKTLVAAKASLSGPYLGELNVTEELAIRQIEHDVEEERRQEGKPNFTNATRKLAILFP